MTRPAPADARAGVAQEHWRPRYHVTGTQNWINDPNGPAYRDGRYHLFFQANQDAPSWGPPHWGHVSSPDLVRWTRHPTALTPSSGGPDADGCWSGCLRPVAGRPAIYYTGVVGDGEERIESVCRAWGSGDLSVWTKDEENPLIPGPPNALGSGYHRDPFLWHDGERWQMLLGSGTTVGERHGQVLRYDSPDGTTWDYRGVFFAGPRSPDGLDLGEHWECPQLVVDGDRAALVVSCQVPGSARPLMHAVWFAGSIVDGRFEGVPAGLVDHGDCFYAPAVMTDGSGRTLIWGWAQESVPGPTQVTMRHVGALSVPRVLSLDGGRIAVTPAPELDALRLSPVDLADARADPAGVTVAGLALELIGVPEDGGWTVTDGMASLSVRADDRSGSLAVLVTDPVTGDRTFAVRRAPGAQVRVFVDGSLVEVFSDGAAVTTRVYWNRPSLQVSADHAGDLRAWRLDPYAVR